MTKLQHNKDTIRIKEQTRLRYLRGERDVEVLAARAGRSDKTVYRWIKEWEKKYPDEIKVEKEIKSNISKALNTALKEFIKDPTNGPALQSVASLLKQHQQIYEPSKELNNYIILFLDQLITYCIDTNNEELRKMLQPEVEDLADYLRKKNNG